MARRVSLVGIVVSIAASGCGDSPEGRTFFERSVTPILDEKCATGTSGCHAINDGDVFGIAAGNLDVTSFAAIQKRRDTLVPFGAYPYPLLLIKAVGPGRLQFQYNGTFRPIDVQHSGGGLIDVGSDAYFVLQAWLDAGATENGLRPATPAIAGDGACTPTVPPGFDAAAFQNLAGFGTFRTLVQPILDSHGCTAGSCHGAPQSDFFLTCGDSDEQVAFNFSQAWAFVNDPVDDSQLLRIPLAVAAGGRGHTGGDQFASADVDDFKVVKEWARSVGKRPFGDGDPLRQFFADNVQPALVQRGCQFMACHSPQATNDFKLRSGFIGFFSAVALERNYKLLRDEFLALEFPDARRGRAVAKALQDSPRDVVGPVGIAHRGGGVLDTGGQKPDPALCGAFNPATSTPFCTVQEWLTRERAALGDQVTDMTPGLNVPVVYVERPPASATAGRLEFDEFHGGAELKVATATFGAVNQALEPIDAGSGVILSANCPGLGAGGDIQTPSVANDGDRVVFAGRASAAEPLGVFAVRISTRDCARLTPAEPDSNGLKVHNFDPVFSPDGAFVVFASTRGAKGAPSVVRSRRRLLPQSDLWRMAVTGLAGDVATLEKMTFLSNSELGPAFMREGRVTMTTEKTSDGFYQLSGRRINWDLTDYHPLLAQRKESRFVDPAQADLATTLPSIGFSSATDIREGSNGDFLLVLSDVDPTTGAPAVRGAAGALGVFNRSVGPFEATRNDAGYLKSLRIVGEPSATGRAGAAGGYRRPQSLPDGRILAAFASNVASGNFEIHMVDPRSNVSTPLFTNGGGAARVDAVVAYKYPPRELYFNRRQLVFGGGLTGGSDSAIMHMPDAPMVFTLLLGNLRRGRPLAEFDRARRLVVYREGLCPTTGCTAGAGGFFESRQLLGSADLADDGSVKVILPSSTGLVFELQDSSGASIAKMTEEHQLGPGEQISVGVSRRLFDGVCGGCHGSISANELDVSVTPDALTGASASAVQSSLPSAPN
jgi:hypothetical protein